MPPPLSACREAGYVLLRLPLEVRDLFREWLMANFPDRYRHVFKLIRETRGGKDYDSSWGKRMTGGGPVAWMIGRRFELACEKLGFNTASHETDDGPFQSATACGGATELVLTAVIPRQRGAHGQAHSCARAQCPHPLSFRLRAPGRAGSFPVVHMQEPPTVDLRAAARTIGP